MTKADVDPQNVRPKDSRSPNARPWPSTIKLKKRERVLEIDFDGGDHFVLPAELLRVESPSAEVQGHGPGQKQIVGGKRDVAITGLEPVGNYAMRIIFSDGHDSGLYTWETLHRLGRDRERIWNEYLEALRSKRLHRG